MLLVLNVYSFAGEVGELLAREVRAAMNLKLPLLTVHLPDLPGQPDGCRFERFFSITPPDLIRAGLYKPIAVPWYERGPHRFVSSALCFKVLNATPVKKKRLLSRVRLAFSRDRRSSTFSERASTAEEPRDRRPNAKQVPLAVRSVTCVRRP